MSISNNKFKLSRDKILTEKLVIVDGQPGCGKTLFSPVVSSLKNVEIFNYIFEIEFICRIFEQKKIKIDAASTLIKMLVDQKLYNLAQGRETNFRYNDISGVFNHHDPSIYFKRIFEVGDMQAYKKIKKNKPILNFTTHDLFSSIELLSNIFKKNLIFIEVIRHPLYMIIQQTLNMERLLNNPRDIQLYFKYKNKELPYFARGWEDLFIKSNDVDKAVYTIKSMTDKNNKIRKRISNNSNINHILIPFEDFVLNPSNYLKNILEKIGTNYSKNTKKILLNNKVPRKKISDSIALDIYKRCGWKPPEKNTSEQDEIEIRRDFLINQKSSKKAQKVIYNLSKEYEKKYMKNIL